MKKSLLIFFISICLVHKIYSQDWINFTSNEGRFSVSLPSQPKMEKDSFPTFTTTGYVSQQFGLFFGVAWFDYKKDYSIDMKKELETFRDNFVKEVNATLVKSNYSNFRGDKCIDFIAKQGNHFWTSEIFFVDHRFYLLYTKTFEDEDELGEDSGSKEEMKFYNSFTLKKD